MQPSSRLLGALVGTFLLLAPQLSAQQSTVTGRVTDQQSGEPIAAVQVLISGLALGGLTQQDGRYVLTNIPVGTHQLSAQRIGYRTLTVQITVAAGAPTVQNFAIAQEALGLDEIIVTGTPGGTQRRAIGNAVTTLQASDIAQTVAVSSAQDLLTGRSPGVQFTRVSGNVGTGAPIEIRGTKSFNLTTNPLIYVDGVRVNNNTRAGPQIGEGQQVSVLNDFNPQDIESIEIIKGPAAATLYGTEASAGVIQIITKRGAQGAPQFEMSVRGGTNFLRDPAGKVGTMWSCKTKYAPPCNETTGLIPYNPYQEGNLLLHDGTLNSSRFVTEPWPEEHLFSNGTSQSYNLGVRGGTDAVRYFLSGNYDYDEGVEFWNSNKAVRLRANVNVVFSPKLTLDASTGFVDGFTVFGNQARADGGVWEDLVWGNGYCVPRINGVDACPRLMGFQEHLPTDVARIRVTRDFNRFTGGATFNFNPSTWLSTRATFGIDQGWDENTELYPLEVVEPVYFRMPIGEITVARPKNSNLSLDLSATAKRNLGTALSTATSVGVQYHYKDATNFGVTGVGLAAPVSRTINQTPSALSTIRYDYIENKSLGAYVQEQIGWNERLFVTGAIRFDDNSAFGASLDPEIYPKLAATWVVSEESFWGFAPITSLRLRGAWGQAGRQPDAFARVTRYGVADGPFGTTAFRPVGPGNDEVGPERSTELELGFDVALLDSRVSGEFTWFTQKNDNALLSVDLAPSLGLAGSIQQNLGRIDNWGWEAALRNTIYESRDLTFAVDLTGSHVDNEIKSLGSFAGNNNIKVGYPYPNYTHRYWIESAEWNAAGLKTNAYNQRLIAMCDSGVRVAGAPDSPASAKLQYGLLRGGTPVDCEKKDTERVLTGRAFFTYRFGISPRLTLFDNALQLHVLADGAYGKANQDTKDAGFRYDNQRISRTEDDPVWVAGDRYGTSQVWGFYDASFWKLREVGLRYQLPQSVTDLVGANRASISFSGRELGELWRAQSHNWGAVMTDGELSDPSQGGSNYRVMPPLTSLNVELRVTF
jgi:TonB-linked SusC/RagA family outer membrane protein